VSSLQYIVNPRPINLSGKVVFDIGARAPSCKRSWVQTSTICKICLL